MLIRHKTNQYRTRQVSKAQDNLVRHKTINVAQNKLVRHKDKLVRNKMN